MTLECIVCRRGRAVISRRNKTTNEEYFRFTGFEECGPGCNSAIPDREKVSVQRIHEKGNIRMEITFPLPCTPLRQLAHASDVGLFVNMARAHIAKFPFKLCFDLHNSSRCLYLCPDPCCEGAIYFSRDVPEKDSPPRYGPYHVLWYIACNESCWANFYFSPRQGTIHTCFDDFCQDCGHQYTVDGREHSFADDFIIKSKSIREIHPSVLEKKESALAAIKKTLFDFSLRGDSCIMCRDDHAEVGSLVHGGASTCSTQVCHSCYQRHVETPGAIVGDLDLPPPIVPFGFPLTELLRAPVQRTLSVPLF